MFALYTLFHLSNFERQMKFNKKNTFSKIKKRTLVFNLKSVKNTKKTKWKTDNERVSKLEKDTVKQVNWFEVATKTNDKKGRKQPCNSPLLFVRGKSDALWCN